MLKKFVASGIGSFLLAVLVLAPSGCGTGGKDNVPGDLSSKGFKLDVNFSPWPENRFKISVHGKIENADDKLFLAAENLRIEKGRSVCKWNI